MLVESGSDTDDVSPSVIGRLDNSERIICSLWLVNGVEVGVIMALGELGSDTDDAITGWLEDLGIIVCCYWLRGDVEVQVIALGHSGVDEATVFWHWLGGYDIDVGVFAACWDLCLFISYFLRWNNARRFLLFLLIFLIACVRITLLSIGVSTEDVELSDCVCSIAPNINIMYDQCIHILQLWSHIYACICILDQSAAYNIISSKNVQLYFQQKVQGYVHLRRLILWLPHEC